MSNTSARLYLTVSAESAEQRRHLPAVLEHPTLACIRLRSTTSVPDSDLKAIVVKIEDAGVAALFENEAERASRLGVDGIHLTGSKGLDAALKRFKPQGIVGVGGLLLRDDAMAAGESEVDYLMFGEDDELASFEDRLDRVGWWAEIFQVPCVACADAFDEVEAFAAAGAEFVALDGLIWNDARGPSAALAEAGERLAQGEAAFLARLAENA